MIRQLEAMFKPVRTTRISEEIATQIKEKLLAEKLQPDDKLPSENGLAEMFGASRATVREALRSLEGAGFIVIKRGARGGPYVASRGLERAGRTLSDALRLRGTPIAQLTEARLIVEPALARLAAERATSSDLEAVAQTNHNVEEKLEAGQNPVLENLAFHRSVARASQNAVLVVILNASLDVLTGVVEQLDIDRRMVRQMLTS
ncbi:MAG: FadR/GntR family transcriptional regulator, partial [Acidobacteriota bacterium]